MGAASTPVRRSHILCSFAVACYTSELPAVILGFWYSVQFSLSEGGEYESNSSSELLPSFSLHSIFVIYCSLMPPPPPPALCRYLIPLLRVSLVRVNRIYLLRVVFFSVLHKLSPSWFLVYLFLFRTSVVLLIAAFPFLSFPFFPSVSQSSEHLSHILLRILSLLLFVYFFSQILFDGLACIVVFSCRVRQHFTCFTSMNCDRLVSSVSH